MTFNPDLLAAKPVTEMDWLLQHGDIIESDNTSHIEAVQDAIELLSPQSKFCVEAIFYEGIPYSKLGERLGVSKPHAWRLANKAIEELRQLLTTNKTLNERYDMFDTWDEAAEATLKSMDTFSTKRKVETNELDKFVLNLTGFVYDTIYEEAAEMDMGDLGLLAASHLKSVGVWDTEDMTNLLVRKQKDYGHQNIFQSIWSMGIIDNDHYLIWRLIRLESTGYIFQNTDPPQSGKFFQFKQFCSCKNGQ